LQHRASLNDCIGLASHDARLTGGRRSNFQGHPAAVAVPLTKTK